MAPLMVPIHRTNTNTNTNSSASNKNDIWFNAFDFAPGQDENIRWLSCPNQQLVQEKYSQDTEKFRITFDVENFQADQIKIYIQNRKLTISGVYEERSENRYMQNQFERSFDLPNNADVDAMASFITAAHMLVVEIPLNASPEVDYLNISTNANNQRRLSFSLDKFNTSNNQGLLSTSNNQGLLSTSNDLSNLSTSGQQVRRTSMSKTTTTTTSSGSSGVPSEAAELLRNADISTGNSSQTYNSRTTERHSSNTGNQLVLNDANTSSLTNSGNLPIEIPSDLLTCGGTITIQKRRVSVTKGTDGTVDHGASAPLTQSNDAHSTSSTTTSSTHNTNQTGSVPIRRSNDIQSTSSTNTNNTSSNTLNQQQLNTTESRDSKTLSSNNKSRMYTFEEFLQNKTWNPSLIDGSDGKKILHMRLQMKPGVTSDLMKVSLNGHDLRVEVDNKVSSDGGRQISGHSYRQVTLFHSCEVDQLKTELKEDGYLHVQVPINL
jgi:HSP20 family molecular chaperone IbpA